MKTRLFFLIAALSVFTAPLALLTGCSTPPTQRSEAVTTLKVIGASVDASMKVASSMYHDGKISAAQWQMIDTTHARFQAAYNVAIAGVQANLDSIASPDLMALAGQIAIAVQKLLPEYQ